MDAKETNSLLHEADEDCQPPVFTKPESRGRRYRGRIHIALLYATILVLIAVLGWNHLFRSRPDLLVYSPLNRIIRYEATVFYDNIDQISPYQGQPDDEKDLLWDLLYRHTETTRVPAPSAARLPNQTMAIPGTDGDGIISLEVFHQLHCLNSLRKSLYPHRYPDYSVFFPNGTRDPDITRHHDHCIDRIRQELMCSSNVGHSYWRWNRHANKWWINMQSTHTCRNFDDILQWTVA